MLGKPRVSRNQHLDWSSSKKRVRINGSFYQDREEDEGHDGLPDFDLIRRDPLEDDEEPDVGEHREEGGHHEHDDLKHDIVVPSWREDLKLFFSLLVPKQHSFSVTEGAAGVFLTCLLA